jgi:hypothetical protein
MNTTYNLKYRLMDAMQYGNDTSALAQEAIDEIERLNSEASMKENAFRDQQVGYLLEIKKLHEKVILLQEQKASLNASLEHYERYER